MHIVERRTNDIIFQNTSSESNWLSLYIYMISLCFLKKSKVKLEKEIGDLKDRYIYITFITRLRLLHFLYFSISLRVKHIYIEHSNFFSFSFFFFSVCSRERRDTFVWRFSRWRIIQPRPQYTECYVTYMSIYKHEL